jgi:ABC-type transporter Mla subunit MlaD
MLHSIKGGQHPHASPTPIIGTVKPTSEDLADLLSGVERMASILSTLLQEGIKDTGKGRQSLSVSRQDARDIDFAAQQLVAAAEKANEIWRAIP